MTSTRYLLLMFMFSLVGHHQWDGLELAWHVKLRAITFASCCTMYDVITMRGKALSDKIKRFLGSIFFAILSSPPSHSLLTVHCTASCMIVDLDHSYVQYTTPLLITVPLPISEKYVLMHKNVYFTVF